MSRLWLLTLLLLLGGCAERSPPLQVGGNDWLGYQPFFLAAEFQLFGEGVQLQHQPSSLHTLRAFREGALDVALMTLDEALLLAESGQPMCIPLVMSYSNGADSLLAHEPLDSLAALAGSRIGVEDTGVGAHMLARVLEQGGLTLGDIQLVPLTLDETESAFLKRRVDAVITFEPLRSRLLAQGGHELYNSAAIPGEISDLLVVNPEILQREPLRFARLLDGWFAALALLEAGEPEAMAWLQRRTELDEPSLQQSLRLIQFHSLGMNLALQSNSQHPFRQTMRQLNEVMLERQVIGSRQPVNRLICGASAAMLYPVSRGGL